jgi:hypothetical protein
MNRYPVLGFLSRSGIWAAFVAALIPVVGIPLLLGAEPRSFIGGLVLGALTFVVVKSYVELIQLITDMLLPK